MASISFSFSPSSNNNKINYNYKMLHVHILVHVQLTILCTVPSLGLSFPERKFLIIVSLFSFISSSVNFLWVWLKGVVNVRVFLPGLGLTYRAEVG